MTRFTLAAAFALLAQPALAQPTLAQDKVSLILDWFVNPDHAPIIIAQEKGFFTDEGLEVEVIAPADPADPPKLVAAGKAEERVDIHHERFARLDALRARWRAGAAR